MEYWIGDALKNPSGEISISWAITPTAMWASITHDRHVGQHHPRPPCGTTGLGVLNSEGANQFLVVAALCGASLTVGGAGRGVYDWVSDAKAKEAKALLALRRSKIEAIQASTVELKGIKESIEAILKMTKEPAKPRKAEEKKQ